MNDAEPIPRRETQPDLDMMPADHRDREAVLAWCRSNDMPEPKWAERHYYLARAHKERKYK